MRSPLDLLLRPEPPSAGRMPLADPRVIRRRWVISLVIVILAGAVAWPFGLGSLLDEMRRDVVARGYLRAATAAATAVPPRRAEALAAIDRALALTPRRETQLQVATELGLSLRAYQEVRAWLGESPQLPPLSRISLGHCLLMTGEAVAGAQMVHEALAEIITAQKAGSQSPAFLALALNNAAYALACGGQDLPRARTYAMRALALEPLQPAFLDSIGWVEYRRQRYHEAAFYLEKALRLHYPEDSAEMQYHLGMAYASLGRVHGSRRAFERCLELDPTWTEARRELERLEQFLPPPNLVIQPSLDYLVS